MNKLLVTIALGASIISTGAFAQNEGGRGGWMADQSRQQAQQRTDMLFQMLDANHDGSAMDDVVGMVGKFLGGTR